MTSYKLKLIAIITMLIDHTAKIFGQAALLLLFPDQWEGTAMTLRIMGWIGRIAFVLFAFMIAEGCAKTRSMPKYVGRLALFAVISQPFYHLAFGRAGQYSESGIADALLSLQKPDNIFVVLTLGAAAIWAFQGLKQLKRKWLIWLTIPVLAVTCLIASYVHTGYDGWGVALIFGFYLLRSQRFKVTWAAAWAIVFYGLFSSWNGTTFAWVPIRVIPVPAIEQILMGIMPCLAACIAAVLIRFYNGERGRRAKWVFYAFYPAHLAVLSALNAALWR
ncbi:conjugal transfer protein TraX [Clostridia bacterium]|nr:conjugal transfer protein TraX [Clostridia bacterium]